ncbi:MAG: sensor histidine kinase, partial [Kofleriaceae bacterium]
MLTLVLIAVGAWATWSSYDTTRELAGRQMRLVALKGVVTQLDEVLTMSARMAAATGDLVWEERYRRYEPELGAAIKEMLEVATVRIERFCARTDAANQALVAMENRAFERVRAGSREEASSILFGGVYEEQKKIYAAGMASTMSSIESAMDEALDAHGTRVSVGVVVASVLLAVSLFAWARNAWQLRARSARLAEALERSERDHAALAEAHQQLEKFHRELVAREKLSSLGLLAAGVAHEINNPMAFITMNVQTLIEDLRDVPPEQLPDALRVYADELLPSTIDGIQRVNTIVRDLQQFARGDIDTQCEFDLNAEIAAA